MRAIHPSELLIRKRLYPDAEPVYACRFPAIQIFRGTIVGIALERDLRICTDTIERPDSFKHSFHFGGGKQAWRTSPEINGGNRPGRFRRRAHFQLLADTRKH